MIDLSSDMRESCGPECDADGQAAPRPAARRVTSHELVALGLAALLGGCASVTSFGSVTPLPRVAALQGQSAQDQAWDFKDCQAEAGYRTSYSPVDSPLGNLAQKLFFWGTAGAALGGVVDGLPTVVGESEASTGLIVGASTGGAVGAVASLSGQARYESEWAACMQARGYAIVPPGQEPAVAPPGR